MSRLVVQISTSRVQRITPRGQYIMSRGQHITSRGQYITSSGKYTRSRGQHTTSRGHHIISRGQDSMSRGQDIKSCGQNLIKEPSHAFLQDRAQLLRRLFLSDVILPYSVKGFNNSGPLQGTVSCLSQNKNELFNLYAF